MDFFRKGFPAQNPPHFIDIGKCIKVFIVVIIESSFERHPIFPVLLGGKSQLFSKPKLGAVCFFERPVYSVVISSCRSFLLLSACLIILTQLIGENGIWLSPAVSESLCLIITLLFFLRYKSGRRAEKTVVTITENSI